MKNPLKELFGGAMTPGVLGVFGHLDDTTRAVKDLKADGREDFTVFSPVPRHELEDAIDRPTSSVRMYTLIGGIAGCSIGAWITLYMSWDWPIQVGRSEEHTSELQSHVN